MTSFTSSSSSYSHALKSANEGSPDPRSPALFPCIWYRAQAAFPFWHTLGPALPICPSTSTPGMLRAAAKAGAAVLCCRAAVTHRTQPQKHCQHTQATRQPRLLQGPVESLIRTLFHSPEQDTTLTAQLSWSSEQVVGDTAEDNTKEKSQISPALLLVEVQKSLWSPAKDLSHLGLSLGLTFNWI